MALNFRAATDSIPITWGQQSFLDLKRVRNLVRDQEVEGSNPFAPTISIPLSPGLSANISLNRLSLTVQTPLLFGLQTGLLGLRVVQDWTT